MRTTRKILVGNANENIHCVYPQAASVKSPFRTLLASILLAFGLKGVAGASLITLDHSDAVTFSSGNVLNETGTFEWSHAMPTNFSIPPAKVVSSSLRIISRRASDNDDIVWVIDFRSLGSLGATGNSDHTTSFDLKKLGVFDINWLLGQRLSLSLAYDQLKEQGNGNGNGNGNDNNNTLTMVSSTFSMTYTLPSQKEENRVPEPGTLALLGLGLLGGVLVRRRKA